MLNVHMMLVVFCLELGGNEMICTCFTALLSPSSSSLAAVVKPRVDCSIPPGHKILTVK